eukprot:scaffold20904_cov37-Tisochrysis_lutea.AAC.1
MCEKRCSAGVRARRVGAPRTHAEAGSIMVCIVVVAVRRSCHGMQTEAASKGAQVAGVICAARGARPDTHWARRWGARLPHPANASS